MQNDVTETCPIFARLSRGGMSLTGLKPRYTTEEGPNDVKILIKSTTTLN